MLPDDAQLENKTISKFEAKTCLSKRMTEPFERTKTPKLNESYFSNIFPVTASTLESFLILYLNDCNFSFFTGSYLFETLSERLKRCPALSYIYHVLIAPTQF